MEFDILRGIHDTEVQDEHTIVGARQRSVFRCADIMCSFTVCKVVVNRARNLFWCAGEITEVSRVSLFLATFHDAKAGDKLYGILRSNPYLKQALFKDANSPRKIQARVDPVVQWLTSKLLQRYSRV